MKLVDILVLGTSAEKRVGSNPTEGMKAVEKSRSKYKLLYIIIYLYYSKTSI